MSGPAAVDGFDFSIASIPPSLRQQRIAYGIIAILSIGLAVIAWLGSAQLPRFDSFVPTVEGIIFVTDVATSALLFSLFFSIGSRELLVLADGYLFSGLIVIPHILSYPGAFAPNGLFVSDLQTTPWLYTFWHFGFSAAVLGYACLKKEKQHIAPFNANRMSVIFWNAVGVFLLVCALTWIALASKRLLLPPLIADQVHFAPMANYVTAVTLVTSIFAMVILWLRSRSTLDLWLLVAIFATVAEQTIVSLVIASRFSLGFYSSRVFSVAVSTIVLIALLSETISIYANLARLTRTLQRERDNKLMSAQTITAAIAHEVRQPLAAIAMNASAARRFLLRPQPDHTELEATLSRIVSDTQRTSEVFESMRNLFRTSEDTWRPVDLNEVIRVTLQSLGEEVKNRGVLVRTTLASDLPHVTGQAGQLQEVVLNLAYNAMDAMASTTDRSRLLLIRTAVGSHDSIVVQVEDSGQGIDPKQLVHVFDAFFTTKKQGMGFGLAICHMIIEHHGGRLTASSDGKSGAIFQFALPVRKSGDGAFARQSELLKPIKAAS